MPDSRRVIAALDDLAACLTSASGDLVTLAERAQQVSSEVTAGRQLRDVVAEEPQPLIIARLTQLLDELADSGAEVRRAEAAQLNAEGLSQGAIARIFGVTRQRVSALLAPPPAAGARAVNRPRTGA